MATRNIITINEEKCVGCGKCVAACHQGALKLVDGKAKLVSEDYCDGLGICVGGCPTGALKVEAREVEDAAPATPEAPFVCPGLAQRRFGRPAEKADASAAADSELTHWPIQLKLINPTSPVYQGADVLIAADCTAFSLGVFHGQLLRGRALIIACPKLDDPTGYVEKLTALFAEAKPRSVTVARMSVPCCGGLTRLVLAARDAAGVDTPVRRIVIGVEGEIAEDTDLAAAGRAAG